MDTQSATAMSMLYASQNGISHTPELTQAFLSFRRINPVGVRATCMLYALHGEQ